MFHDYFCSNINITYVIIILTILILCNYYFDSIGILCITII